MNYKEYGADKQNTIILLHGGGLSWWNYREEAEMLQNDYHVILPLLDGHAGSDRPFTTIENNASELISFVNDHLGGSVLLIGGLSLGGQILLEMLSQRRDLCRYALIESAMIVPSKLTHALIAPALGSSYGLIRNESFARLQFKSLHMKAEIFDDYYRDTCRISKSDMIAFVKANTSYMLKESITCCLSEMHVFVGEKENRGLIQSAKILNEKVPGCVMKILPELHHGEYSLNHANEYVNAIRSIVRG